MAESEVLEELADAIERLEASRCELIVHPKWGPLYRYHQKIGNLPSESVLRIVTSPFVPDNSKTAYFTSDITRRVIK